MFGSCKIVKKNVSGMRLLASFCVYLFHAMVGYSLATAKAFWVFIIAYHVLL